MDTAARNRLVVTWTLALCAVPALAVLAISLAFSPERIAVASPFAWFGLHPPPCPGCALCGMSRAFCAVSHLRLADALHFNPLVALLYPLAWALALGVPSFLVARRLRRS